MTFDYDAAEREYKKTDTAPTEWLDEGEHRCKIVDSFVDNNKDGIPCLFIWLEEIGTGLKGRIQQSFEYPRFLKMTVESLGFNWKSLREIEDNAGLANGMIVEVNSVKKGQFTNHYIQSVVERPPMPEPTTAQEGDDGIPF
jgi:hypothetical protein